MSKNNGFALVPRPPGALEKAEPGAKRILSDMVADTLRLAKMRLPHSQRPLRIVSVDDEDWRLELVEMTISGYFKGVTVQSFLDAEEAWQELSRTDPDLLITDDIMGKLNGDEIVHRLAERKVAYPIIVINAYGPERDQWVSDCVKRGMDVTVLHAPYSLESLARAVESGLKISRDLKGPIEVAPQAGRALPPRIVMMNSELGPLQSCEVVIRHSYTDAELVLFQDSIGAWQELSHNDPDLLITGTWFPIAKGKEIVERLMVRKATYPIIVMSAYEPEELWVREYASRGLNIKFLSMPFDVTTFLKVVAASLNIPPDTKYEQ
jgi:DNA-binding NtrC family response regulator